MWNFVSYIAGVTYGDGVLEQGAEEDTWAWEELGNMGQGKTA